MYTIENFTTDFIDYLKDNLNTKIDALNLDNEDGLLKQINKKDYYFSTENNVQNRVAQGIFYYTPEIVAITGNQKFGLTYNWRIELAYSDGGREAKIDTMQKLLRYQVALQLCIQDFFKRVGYCVPEIAAVGFKDEKTGTSLYRIVNFSISATIA